MHQASDPDSTVSNRTFSSFYYMTTK